LLVEKMKVDQTGREDLKEGMIEGMTAGAVVATGGVVTIVVEAVVAETVVAAEEEDKADV